MNANDIPPVPPTPGSPPKLHVVKDPTAPTSVFIDTNEARITYETIIAIDKQGGVYQRGGKIVEPRLIPAPTISGKDDKTAVSRQVDYWQVVEAQRSRVRLLAAERCHFTKNSKNDVEIEANVPDWLPSSVLSVLDWPFPVLAGIIEAPTIRPDGSILDKPGYDKETGIFLAPNNVQVSVPELPTYAEAQAAAERLLDVVCDFPFSSPAGRSVWLSGVLSVAARPTIDGPVPMHIIDASIRGSGKSKLVDAAAIITTGRPADRMAYTDSDEEMDKRITALGIAGDETVLIDNVVGEFGCPSLDAAITSTSYRGRVLGKSEMTPHLPMRIVWWATANGVLLGADLARRSVLSRLEPQCEHPEERDGPKPGVPWRHPRLLHYVTQHRGQLLSAALTVVRAYISCDRPTQNLRSMDFDAWTDIVRNIIVWLGYADPALTLTDVRSADTRADAFRALVEAWPYPDGSRATATDLIAAAEEVQPFGAPDGTNAVPPVPPENKKIWRHALTEWCHLRHGEDLPSKRALGNQLRAVKGVVVGNHRIDMDGKGQYGAFWVKRCVSAH